MTPGLIVEEDSITDSRIWISSEESKHYLEGSGVEGGDVWRISEEASGIITGEDCPKGKQSLQIVADEALVGAAVWVENVPRQGVRFIKVRVRPMPIEEYGAAVHLHLFDTGAGAGRFASFSFPMNWNTEERTEPCVNMVIREGIDAATWDLFLTDELVAVDLTPGEFSESIEVGMGAQEAVYLDAIGIGVENPLFADSDGDNINNISEYRAGTPPNAASSVLLTEVIYADNSTGRDSNSDWLFNSRECGGPMFSIKAAMAAARTKSSSRPSSGAEFTMWVPEVPRGSRSPFGQ